MSLSSAAAAAAAAAGGGAMAMDEKKRKRMQSNRESAKRSRLKREQRVKDLVNEIQSLKQQILEFSRQYDDMRQRTHDLLSENENLNAEKTKLGEYLNSLYSIYMRFTQQMSPSNGCLSNQNTWQVSNLMQPMGMSGS